MGFLQLLSSLWPFFKEMFVGEKIKESASSKRGRTGPTQAESPNHHFAVTIARWCITKMQTSRRFLATVFLFLLLSVFVNYKLLGKIDTATLPRNEEKAPTEESVTNVSKEVPTIPRDAASERDAIHEQTVRELKKLYGDTQ